MVVTTKIGRQEEPDVAREVPGPRCNGIYLIRDTVTGSHLPL